MNNTIYTSNAQEKQYNAVLAFLYFAIPNATQKGPEMDFRCNCAYKNGQRCPVLFCVLHNVIIITIRIIITITKPTHLTDISATILDYVRTNLYSNNIKTGVLLHQISDHLPVLYLLYQSNKA